MGEDSLILGIESSCDDTAAAVVKNGALLSSVVSTQRVHDAYGGVVPELASRDHQRQIVPVVRQALEQSGHTVSDISAVAVTYGPGLAGSLLVGLGFAKAFALARGIPLIGVNHLEGHLFSLFVEDPRPQLPLLCLVVSGGHTQLVLVDADFRHQTLGRTRDDAAGEAFDKVGKLLGLPFPGGPHVDRLAASGNASYVDFPRTRLPGLDFSFSGIKTSVLYHLNALGDDGRATELEHHLPDLCASFQAAVVEMLVSRLAKAVKLTGSRRIALAGGVSANSGLRRAVSDLADRRGLELHVPNPEWCTDNAAMIAIAGYYRALAGHTSPLTLTAEPSLAL